MREIHIPIQPDDESITIVIRVAREGGVGAAGSPNRLGPREILDVVHRTLSVAPDDLRAAVETVLETERPPRTVSGWARMCGLSRSTLWRRWVMHMNAAGGPADFLRAVLAGRAMQLAEKGIPRTAIARCLKLDSRTVKALCESFGAPRSRTQARVAASRTRPVGGRTRRR